MRCAVVLAFQLGMHYSCAVPEVSRFYGIVIAMFYREHEPAHYHVVYAEHRATVEIESKEVAGRLPKRVLNLVLEWHTLNQEELRQNWRRARNRQQLSKIPPLE